MLPYIALKKDDCNYFLMKLTYISIVHRFCCNNPWTAPSTRPRTHRPIRNNKHPAPSPLPHPTATNDSCPSHRPHRPPAALYPLLRPHRQLHLEPDPRPMRPRRPRARNAFTSPRKTAWFRCRAPIRSTTSNRRRPTIISRCSRRSITTTIRVSTVSHSHSRSLCPSPRTIISISSATRASTATNTNRSARRATAAWPQPIIMSTWTPPNRQSRQNRAASLEHQSHCQLCHQPCRQNRPICSRSVMCHVLLWCHKSHHRRNKRTAPTPNRITPR